VYIGFILIFIIEIALILNFDFSIYT